METGGIYCISTHGCIKRKVDKHYFKQGLEEFIKKLIPKKILVHGAMPEHLLDELRNSGYKFSEEDVVMVTKTKKGELVWLEKGNDSKGLKHIIDRHERDFTNKFGVTKKDMPSTIKDIFQNGAEINSKRKNGGLEKVYFYRGKYVVITGVGTNGFIISVYPGGGSK